jgi:hypothetical protein
MNNLIAFLALLYLQSKLTPQCTVFLEKLDPYSADLEILAFIEPEGSVLHSLKYIIGLSPEVTEFSPQPNSLYYYVSI